MPTTPTTQQYTGPMAPPPSGLVISPEAAILAAIVGAWGLLKWFGGREVSRADAAVSGINEEVKVLSDRVGKLEREWAANISEIRAVLSAIPTQISRMELSVEKQREEINALERRFTSRDDYERHRNDTATQIATLQSQIAAAFRKLDRMESKD